MVNTLGDHVGDAHLRGRLHLRIGSNGKDLLGLDPSLTKPVVLLDQQKPLAQPSGSKVVTRRVLLIIIIINIIIIIGLFIACYIIAVG